ncbi:MAG TPA: relaxase/mobilization nuclease domain-containing protein [Ideonella sp.]|uniref:relaxase/mobilization nuclease domain-containing protein n=1 Tax=Ideonella sp. TaxID=1929293 RepID=UPI002CA644E6|nr:relaxase/mobilization nuclease domain-containing protein [Ideonella sp.]HSI48137.1 relaxase/mobilization nuclease domain-containing protein [Ideonella sp.]
MPSTIDGLLVQWGDRLFYPSNRMKASRTPILTEAAVRQRAHALRQRIRATVERRAPQVMVKVTGGGRGMGAIAAHLRYIAKAGRLPIEDDRGAVREGKEALRAIADQWRFGGTRIPEDSERREAFNIMLSMPSGTDVRVLQQAAREFAKAELANHRYVMVLHTHQANPHMHISVRAEGRDGKRLNPRKEDLHRWRETFAEQLRDRGIAAEASSQATRASHGAACEAGSASRALQLTPASAANTSRVRPSGRRAPLRCRPGPRSPGHWRHRPIQPTAS